MRTIYEIGKMRAFLVDAFMNRLGTILVPVLFDSMPHVPKIVNINKYVAVLTSESPLTYRCYGEPYKAVSEGVTMPLVKGKSNKAVSKNIKIEKAAGKPKFGPLPGSYPEEGK